LFYTADLRRDELKTVALFCRMFTPKRKQTQKSQAILSQWALESFSRFSFAYYYY